MTSNDAVVAAMRTRDGTTARSVMERHVTKVAVDLGVDAGSDIA